jgi:hypothetical protein
MNITRVGVFKREKICLERLIYDILDYVESYPKLRSVRFARKVAVGMDISIGDVLVLKKSHPCGSNRFIVLRTGLDFKLKCEKCGHEIMTPRIKVEKSMKNVIRQTHDI